MGYDWINNLHSNKTVCLNIGISKSNGKTRRDVRFGIWCYILKILPNWAHRLESYKREAKTERFNLAVVDFRWWQVSSWSVHWLCCVVETKPRWLINMGKWKNIRSHCENFWLSFLVLKHENDFGIFIEQSHVRIVVGLEHGTYMLGKC